MTMRLPLNDIRAVRREMCRVYRDARSGRIDTRDAARLCFVLAAIRATIEACTLEARVCALEESHGLES